MKRIFSFLLLLFLAACAAQPRTVIFGDAAYQIQNASGSGETYRSPDGRLIEVARSPALTTVIAEGQVYEVSGSRDEVRVTFPDGRVLAARYDPNGAGGIVDQGVDAPPEDWERVDELREIVFHPEAARQGEQTGWRYLLSAMIFGLGLLQLLNPRLAWQFSGGWRFEQLEPGETYLRFSRIVGAALILAALVVAVWR